jgi:hypothetical protein
MQMKNYTYYRSIHVFLCESYILRNLYHLLLCFFIYEHLKLPASVFHDFNKEKIGKKTNFCKIKCYVNTFNKKKSIKVIAYLYSTIIYWTKVPWVSHFKKKAIFTFRTAFSYLLLWNFSDGTGWKILRGAWNAWHKNSGYRGVCFLSVYLFSVI